MESLIKLGSLILLPAMFSILVVYILASQDCASPDDEPKGRRDRLKRLFSFNPDKGLSHQPPLWLAFLTPLSYFFVLGYLSWKTHTVLLSAKGFNNFIEISTLPLALLSLCIPMAVLVSRLHATQQTANQIVATKQKNNVDAFYAHRKAMAEYFGYLKRHSYEGCIDGDFEYHPRLHLKFFSHQRPEKGIPLPNDKKFKECLNLLGCARNEIASLIKQNFSVSLIQNYIVANQQVAELAKIMVLSQIYKHETIWKSTAPSTAPIKLIGESLNDLIGAYRYSRSYMRVLCEFSGYSTDWFEQSKIDQSLIDADKTPMNLSSTTDMTFIRYTKEYLLGGGFIKL